MIRIKRINSHAGYARLLSEINATEPSVIGYIPRNPGIPRPYSHSQTHIVWNWDGKNVVIIETAHRQYDVFRVPPGTTIYATEQAAADVAAGAVAA